jgi:amino acid adenylation domain-containing protein
VYDLYKSQPVALLLPPERSRIPEETGTNYMNKEGIAVVGMSCRFPGATSLREYWNNLCRGKVAVTFLSEAELAAEGVNEDLYSDENYIRAAYCLQDIDKFDADFFGYAGSEVEKIDPQQRIFLECAWEALEDAGYSPLAGGSLDDKSVGVFAGSRISTYFHHVFRELKPGGSAEAFQSLLGNDKDYLCSRVSYKLNLRGPSLGIQSACSSSLSAVHTACESLRTGTCDMALAGGAAVSIPQRAGYLYRDGMIFSPDGYCRPFDKNAGGTVFSNGVGVVVLKRLEDALADSDHVYAVVLSSVVNNDGTRRVGYTAPGEAGQTAVIGEALTLSGLSARDIGYVETHGTGTAIGDPIEFAALRKVFSHFTDEKNFCALGAVKANIGHADAASGIAGFIKAVMAVHTGKIPPHPLFDAPNPAVNFPDSPFYINTEMKEWNIAGPFRAAGISSFGIGGSNAHAVIREIPGKGRGAVAAAADGRIVKKTELFVLSSRTGPMLRELAGRMADSLEETPRRLDDVCFTVQDSRSQDRERLAVVVESMPDLVKALKNFAAGAESGSLLRGRAAPGEGRVEGASLRSAPAAGESGAQARLASLGADYVAGRCGSLAVLRKAAAEAGASRVALPSTPFRRRRYWYIDEPADNAPTDAGKQGFGAVRHTVWENHFVTPDGRVFYRGQLAGKALDQLREHRVHEIAVAPASFIFELMSAAARIEHPEGCSLVDAAVVRPLVTDGKDRVFFQLSPVRNGEAESMELFVSAAPLDAASWKMLARAGVSAPGHGLGERRDIASLQDEFTQKEEPEAYYDLLAEFGLDYGPSFRSVTKIFRQPGRSLVRVDLPKTARRNGRAWDPAVLDACLQSVPAALPEKFKQNGKTFVPSGCASLVLGDPPPETVFALAELCGEPAADADRIFPDITIFDAEGRTVGWVKGLCMSALPVGFAAAAAAEVASGPAALFYEVLWKDLGIPSAAGKPSGNWLILADRRGVAGRIVPVLSEAGCSCVTLPLGGNAALLSKAMEDALHAGGRIHILNCRPLDIPVCAGRQEAYDCGAPAVLDIVRLLAAGGGTERADLVMLTSQAFGPEDTAVAGGRVEAAAAKGDMAVAGGRVEAATAERVLGQALLWGLAPVTATEFPDMSVRVIDIESESSLPDGLWEMLSLEDGETHQALRAGRRHVPRLKFAERQPASAENSTAAEVLAAGGPGLDNLHWITQERRTPGKGEVEVAMVASSLNFRDIMMAMGIYPGERTAIGSDGAGYVSRVGEGVTGLRKGDAVVVSAFGCLRSHLTLPAGMVRKIPPGLSPEQAAGLPVAYITAWYGLVEIGKVQAGQTVLIHAASGGVGLAALSVCRRAGARIFASAGTDAKRGYVLLRGAELVMDSRTAAFGEQVLRATEGRGVDLVLNSLTGELREVSLSVTADGGIFVELGKSGVPEEGEKKTARGTVHCFPVDLVTLGREQPRLTARIFTDTLEACGRGELDVLPYRTFPVADYKDAFRFMVQARHIGKIILARHKDTGSLSTPAGDGGKKFFTEKEPTAFSAHAGDDEAWSELITGGLGGLGLSLARERVRAGCGNLLLVARRDPDQTEQAVIAELEKAGCAVHLLRADVADFESFRAALDRAVEDVPPLERVWHLAGVLDDDLIVNLDAVRFSRVLAPKVEGGWNLHRLTLGYRLKSFVLFSSTAALFGPPGQGSYAAANAALDALALYRRRLGLPALSVNWGAWGGAGMVERGKLRCGLKRFGIRPLPLKAGFAALATLMEQDVCRAVVADMDWPMYLSAHGMRKVSSFLEDTAGQAAVTGGTKPAGKDAASPAGYAGTAPASRFSAQIRGLDVDGLRKFVGARLREKLAVILKVEAAALDGDADLIELGVDSLLALDFFQSAEKDFGIRIERSLLFENPTLNALTARLAEIVNRGISAPKDKLPAVTPDPGEHYAPFRLMDMQQAYWVGRTGALVLGNVSCHVYVEIEMQDLDIAAWRNAWNRLIRRHDMLRCVIAADGYQRILPEVPDLDIPVTDASCLAMDEALATVLDYRERMSHEVLAPDVWPLYRTAVTMLPGGLSRLHISLDLLVADLHSMNMIMNELTAFYLRPETEMKPLSLSFRDYVLGLDEFKQGEQYRQDRRYWMDRLDELAPAPDLPLAVSPSQITHPRFVRHAGILDRETWTRLKQKAAGTGLTVSGLLLACYAEVLAYWSNRPEFTINITLFNRLPMHPEVPQIVGDFTSVSLLSCSVDHKMNFLSRAQRLQRRLWADMDHSSFSGVETVREWVRAGKGAGADIIPVVFTSTVGLGGKNGKAAPLGTLGRVVYSITQTPQVRIDHQVREIDGCLDFNWDVADGLFPKGLVDAMFSSYCRLLGILADDDRVWGYTRLPLLPADQLARRRTANATSRPPIGRDAGVRTLGDFFTRSLKAAPDAPALVYGDFSLSYRALGMRVEALAQALLGAGCGRGSFAAVVSDGGWEEIAAVLAVVCTGSAYMPVDADVPPARLKYLLEYSGVNATLTPSRHAGLVRTKGMPVIVVDPYAPDGRGEFDLERRSAEPGDLAYIIHTSGSTGTPKGVMIRHAGACNTILAVNRLLGLAPEDRVPAVERLTFDLSVWDIFGLLGAGGALVLPDPARRLEAAHWVDLMVKHGVTVWNTVPPLMQILLGYMEQHRERVLPPLRAALLSGDWIPLNLPRRAHALWPDLKLISLGGATEASIWSNYFQVDAVRPEWKSIPYGRPLANQRLYVLNRHGTDCPDLVPGEIHIAGAGLAAGYLNDPAGTAERFVRHPGTGEDLYAAGDLGCYMADGNIEFLGRRDNQVKINGYRVELGEIENALLEHPAVEHAAAVPVKGRQEGRTLAAFVGLKADMPAPTVDELKKRLEQRLPKFLIPGMIFVKDRLPLTSSGKVDRKKLIVEPVLPYQQSAVAAPGTEMERAVAFALAEVLGHSNFGVDSRFFEIGLSSLDLVTVQTLLQEKTGLTVPLTALLEHPGIRPLAAYLAENAGGQAVRTWEAVPSGKDSVKRGMSRAERRVQSRAQARSRTTG